MKIRPVGAEMFHADSRTERRTDMTKLIVAFHNFANAPKSDTTLLKTQWKMTSLYTQAQMGL